MRKILFFILLLDFCSLFAQSTVFSGQIFDKQTKEPIPGATIATADQKAGTVTDVNGHFRIETAAAQLQVSGIGYASTTIRAGENQRIALETDLQSLQSIVVTANREAALRTTAPIAISKLSARMIDETKATNLWELVNKTPGVVMVNLNNEQHSMSIRQPMTTNAYFLYLEDGLPMRPLGIFNHNALIEMNVFGVSSVEVIKGPASSIYGAEAVGGALNFITHRPTAVPTVRVGVQGDQFGYLRTQFGMGGFVGKKLGLYGSGFVARQRNSWLTNTDYDKVSLNGRAEYHFNPTLRLISTMSYNNYDSQMGGSVDSVAFYNRSYQSVADFTFRKIYSFRSRITLEKDWKGGGQSFITGFARDNRLLMNPTFRISWPLRNRPDTLATGEINDNIFQSYGVLAQHSQRFSFWNAKLLAGAMYDYSPNTYIAYQTELNARLRSDRRSVEQFTQLRERPDLVLSNYEAQVRNAAAYAQFDFEPLHRLRFSLGGRFDQMSFDYTNLVDDKTGTRTYNQFAPKVGFTYEIKEGVGVYGNAAQGFSPPSLTTTFRPRPVAAPDGSLFYYNLEPAQFQNYEIGGWASLFRNKLYLDVALYDLTGRNELLSIRQPDGTTDQQSAGRTLHRGVETGLTWRPTEQWFFRFGGAYSIHQFVEFTLSERATDAVKNVNDKDMPSAPRWTYNTELSYYPKWLPHFRTSIEWQRLTEWYMNQVNTRQYDDRTALGMRGVSVFNFRAGYQWRSVEIFTNILNLTDELYAHNVTRGNGNAAADRSTFTPAAPRTVTLGIQYNFTGKQ
jgi:iron complex outermembrane recepter protein